MNSETQRPAVGFWSAVWQDLNARRSAPPSILFFLSCLFTHRGFVAVFLYRLGRSGRRVPGLAWFCRRVGVLLTGVSLHESADIGPGLVLPHPHGVVVGRNVRIGLGVYLYQSVVIGPRGPDEDTAPVIGDFVRLYPHVCVFGDVTVGSETEVGANSVVLKDVPEKSVVMPPPSVVLKGMPFAMRDFLTPSKREKAIS